MPPPPIHINVPNIRICLQSKVTIQFSGQTPAVSNDHDYTIHTPINDQLLAAQVKEKIMNLQRKLVT